jgi:glutamyl-tRNA reductase
VRYADLEPYLISCTGREALLHLVRVIAGLDSLVVGEEQIRGQVREALRRAEAASSLPAPVLGIFQRALESARHVRGSTRLAKLPSIAAAGVHVARRALGTSLNDQLVVVLGAGATARAAAEAVLPLGARVLFLNRTPAHAEELVQRLGPQVSHAALDELPRAARDAALLIGATASRQPVLPRSVLAEAMAARSSRLVVLDIAVPRDVDPAARDIPGILLIDMDDLERDCPLDVATRTAELQLAERLAAEEADRLAAWLRVRAMSPAIAELRTFAEDIRVRELRRSARRLRNLNPEELAAVDALTEGIVRKLLHGPTVALRDAAARPGGAQGSHARILRMVQATRGRTA